MTDSDELPVIEITSLSTHKNYGPDTTLLDISDLLETSIGRHFVEEYLSDNTTTQAVLMLIKIYQMVEATSLNSNRSQKIQAVKDIINDTHLRGIARDKMIEWIEKT